MYIYNIPNELDRDGELAVGAGEDETIYIKESDLLAIASAFGYGLYKPPITK
jgi:hypothetical protein